MMHVTERARVNRSTKNTSDVNEATIVDYLIDRRLERSYTLYTCFQMRLIEIKRYNFNFIIIIFIF